MTGSFKGRGTSTYKLDKMLHAKLLGIGKQLPTFPYRLG